MGQFSWLYSDTQKQVLDGVKKESYLLVPEPFQEKYGKAIREDCYDGYGHFGGYDVYDLVLEWNKDFIPEIIEKMKLGEWKCSRAKKDVKDLQLYYEGEKITCPELRWLGILIACYDEDNEKLKYPIKITSIPMEYNKAAPSKSDPNQGWKEPDDEDENE